MDRMQPVGTARVEVVRLTPPDLTLARQAFSMMAEVFGTAGPPLGDGYLTGLLARPEVWAVAAVVEGEVAGAATAYLLPMTRAEESELFVYDVAVRPDRQRRGVGTALLRHLIDAAADAGAASVFVPADDEDVHALRFYRAIGGAGDACTIFSWVPGD